MSRARGGTLETSLPPMRIRPSSSGSSPASMRSAVDLPDPEGPTSTSSSPSSIESSSSLTAGLVVPGYSRVASSYWTEAKLSLLSLERTHRKAADHPLLRRPACEYHGQAGERRRGGQLREEVAAGRDVRDHPLRHRRRAREVQLDGVEVFVPGKDDAQQRGCGDTRRRDWKDHGPQLVHEGRAVDLRRFDQLARNLHEERASHPHGEWQVDRDVEEDQDRPRADQVPLLRVHVDREDRRDDRQELRRDEEEEDVAPLGHGTDRKRVRSGQ